MCTTPKHYAMMHGTHVQGVIEKVAILAQMLVRNTRKCLEKDSKVPPACTWDAFSLLIGGDRRHKSSRSGIPLARGTSYAVYASSTSWRRSTMSSLFPQGSKGRDVASVRAGAADKLFATGFEALLWAATGHDTRGKRHHGRRETPSTVRAEPAGILTPEAP